MSTVEEIEARLEPIFSALRTSKAGTEVGILKAWAENLGGMLPQLGRAWAEADGEARELKVKAARLRAEIQDETVAEERCSHRKADEYARGSGRYLNALDEWAKAKGRATRLKALREDALEALNSIKASMKPEGGNGF